MFLFVYLVSLDSQPQWRKAVWDPQGKILAYANRQNGFTHNPMDGWTVKWMDNSQMDGSMD